VYYNIIKLYKPILNKRYDLKTIKFLSLSLSLVSFTISCQSSGPKDERKSDKNPPRNSDGLVEDFSIASKSLARSCRFGLSRVSLSPLDNQSCGLRDSVGLYQVETGEVVQAPEYVLLDASGNLLHYTLDSAKGWQRVKNRFLLKRESCELEESLSLDKGFLDFAYWTSGDGYNNPDARVSAKIVEPKDWTHLPTELQKLLATYLETCRLAENLLNKEIFVDHSATGPNNTKKTSLSLIDFFQKLNQDPDSTARFLRERGINVIQLGHHLISMEYCKANDNSKAEGLNGILFIGLQAKDEAGDLVESIRNNTLKIKQSSVSIPICEE